MHPQQNPYQPAPAWQPPRRWWQHPALIVTLLVLLPPVGIVLAWLGRWTNRTKTVATVLSALWFVVVMVMDPPEEPGAGDPKPAVTAPATPTPTEEPSTEAPAPTPEPTTEAPTTEAPTPTPEPTTEAPTPDPTTPEPTTEAPKPAPTTPKPATPKPKPPAPTTRPAETAEPEPDPAPYYANCTAVRAAGADPIHVGEPGYGRHLDRDGDGVACE